MENVSINLKSFELMTLTKVLREVFNQGKLEEVIDNLSGMERNDIDNIVQNLISKASGFVEYERGNYED